MSGAHWFDREKLLPGESLVREGFARLRTHEPPYWWEGDLILTSERLFFLPNVHNPLAEPAAYWLAKVLGANRDGYSAIVIDAGAEHATFQVAGHFNWLPWVARRRVKAWLGDIKFASRRARPPRAFEQRDDRAVG
jgi:hypothetical protein